MEIKEMALSINTRQAYSEIDEFLGLLNVEKRNKIPEKLRELFTREKDSTYKKGIDPTIPIKEQNLKEETLAIIALLNLQYWEENEEEKQRLQRVYAENEKRYQEQLRKKFNPDDIFRKKITKVDCSQENIEDEQIIKYKETIFKRIWNRILRLLHFR